MEISTRTRLERYSNGSAAIIVTTIIDGDGYSNTHVLGPDAVVTLYYEGRITKAQLEERLGTIRFRRADERVGERVGE